jgi:hypothetical protein
MVVGRLVVSRGGTGAGGGTGKLFPTTVRMQCGIQHSRNSRKRLRETTNAQRVVGDPGEKGLVRDSDDGSIACTIYDMGLMQYVVERDCSGSVQPVWVCGQTQAKQVVSGKLC